MAKVAAIAPFADSRREVTLCNLFALPLIYIAVVAIAITAAIATIAILSKNIPLTIPKSLNGTSAIKQQIYVAAKPNTATTKAALSAPKALTPTCFMLALPRSESRAISPNTSAKMAMLSHKYPLLLKRNGPRSGMVNYVLLFSAQR